MAGKNECSMTGKGWREHMAGKGCAEYVIVLKKPGIVRKKMVACTSRPTAGQLVLVGPLQAYRPTAGRLGPVGQLEADWEIGRAHV